MLLLEAFAAQGVRLELIVADVAASYFTSFDRRGRPRPPTKSDIWHAVWGETQAIASMDEAVSACQRLAEAVVTLTRRQGPAE